MKDITEKINNLMKMIEAKKKILMEKDEENKKYIEQIKQKKDNIIN